MLCGCVLPEEYRFTNPTESIEWEPTEPIATTAPAESPETTPPSNKTAEDIVDDMTLQQQVAQLFLVKCPAGGAIDLLRNYHVGGIILYGQDIAGHTPDSLRSKLADYQSRVPVELIIAVDEEGGIVNRVSSNKSFRSKPFQSPREAYLAGGINAVTDLEAEKSKFLKNLGINVNLAPVCDVVTEDTGFMADRSLRLTAKDTADTIAAMVKTMQKHKVGAVLKHFPGYGNLVGDTHTGRVTDSRSLEELCAYDLKPFIKGIDADVGAIMVGHSIVACLNKDLQLPASLSPYAHEYLRDTLEFEGVIMTDDLNMGAVTDHYEIGEATVQAILAGNDMLITSWSEAQYNAVLEAVKDGRITKARIRESAIRIVQWKLDLGLM